MSSPNFDPRAIAAGSVFRQEKPGATAATRYVAGCAAGRPGPNSAAAFAYAEARLRSGDEARSADLASDPRVYAPDPDEESTRPCGAPRVP